MASPSEIRHHIAAVEQTKKITGAMELVSSTRMKRVMRHIEHNRRYFDSVQRTMKELLITRTTSRTLSARHQRGG
jgi:F0F1-type ATP synthase gamma subunit